jgi:hypothetical protein
LRLIGDLRVDGRPLFVVSPESVEESMNEELLPGDARLAREDHRDGRRRHHERHEEAESEKLEVERILCRLSRSSDRFKKHI